MSYVAVQGDFMVPAPPRNPTTTPDFQTATMNTIGQKYGAILTSPITDTITKIAFAGNASGSGGDIEIRIETVDTATGFPSGTLWGTNTNATVTVPATPTGMYEATLTSAASVNMGDMFAIVAVCQTTNAGVFRAGFNDGGNAGIPQVVLDNTGSAWAVTSGAPVFSVNFGTNGYFPIRSIAPVNAVATQTFNSGSTPDVYGNKITPSQNMKVNGVWIWADFDGNSAINLYGTDGVTILASATNSLNTPPATTGFINFRYLNAEIELLAGSSYYLGVEPSTATSMSLYALDFLNSSIKSNYTDATVVSSSAKNPSGVGSWTDLTTRVYMVGLIVSQIDNGTGGAGGLITHPGMAGGMRG